MSFELAVGVPVFSSLWRSERDKKRNHVVCGGECVTSGVREMEVGARGMSLEHATGSVSFGLSRLEAGLFRSRQGKDCPRSRG
jgi:hypothetical protein